MTVENDETEQEKAGLPAEIGLILEAIEREPVPERLLTLAVKLQEALAKRRAIEQSAHTASQINQNREI